MLNMPSPGTRTAYLVMILDVSTSPPTINSVGMFSEPSPTVVRLNQYRPIEIHREKGATYEEACDKIRHLIAAHEAWMWVAPLLAKSRGSARGLRL